MRLHAEEQLFKPLEIEEWKWERIPGDYVNASWGIHLRPMDMVKIGYLFLNDGLWNDQEIMTERWRFQSTRFREAVSGFYNYGYFWWRFNSYTDVARKLRENDIFFSWGDGGQYIFVIPHLNMVVVTTAGNYTNSDAMAVAMFL